MGLRHPTGKDLWKIFSLTLSKKALEDWEDIESIFNDLIPYVQTESIALALHHANRNLVNYKKTHHLIKELIITPEVLHSLLTLTKTEEFISTEELHDSIIKQKNSARGRNAVNTRHSQIGGSRDKQQKIRDIFASGKYKNNRTTCAENEHNRIGMSYSTARKALNNTPNPT